MAPAGPQTTSTWKGVASACYFALVVILSLAILWLAPLTDLMKYLLIATALVLGIALYASVRVLGQAGKLPGAKDPVWAQVETVVSIIAVSVLSWVSFDEGSVLFTAIFVGAMGGLVHEIAQSNGRFMLPNTKNGEVYLGGLYGLVAGGVAGLLIAQGLATTAVGVGLLSESFLAGLALKGVSDAVAGTRPSSGPSQGPVGGTGGQPPPGG